ncbi:MAG: LamB/YcsF family protein [Eggerthellaceae bacterium]|jgi:UPF0271 protein
MHTVELNCDLGESFGRYKLGLDEKVIPLISSANVACGFHAGDPQVMRKTIALAKEAGVAVGAHPGYPDLQGFGRRDMRLNPDEVYATVLYQIGALHAFCQAQGVSLHHVKPHGQLYNHAAIDKPQAEAIAAAVHDFNPQLALIALANGNLVEAGQSQGLRVAQEFFMDRNYTDEGVLVPRSLDNAVITDEDFAIKRAIDVIKEGKLESEHGKIIEIQADTICVHGDNVKALEFVRDLRRAFKTAGIDIKAF